MRPARWSSAIWTAFVVCTAFLPGQARATDAGSPPQGAVSASGIPYLSDSEVGPPDVVAAIRARRPGGKLLHLDRMLLHSPQLAKGWNTLFGTIRGDQLAVPPLLREIAIMAIGALNNAPYEWGQHEPAFLSVGGTAAQLAALRNVPAAMKDVALFDEPSRATLALTHEMTRNAAVTPPTMKRIRSLLSDRQVVELVGIIASYNMVSRFVNATGVEME